MQVQHRQRLEITLDIFRGCGHSCAGCMIDKQLGGEVSDIPELLLLIQEMEAVGYVPFDLGVGPTDYMTSNNVQDVMGNETFQEMAQLFHQVTFNAAFLEKDLDKYSEMCQDIDLACPGKPIRFLIPAAPTFFKNDKFGNMIEAKLNHCKEAFQSAFLNEAGFVVTCNHETMDENFDQLIRRGMDVEFPVDKDDILNIPYGRSKNLDLMVSQRVLRVSHAISEFYAGLSGEDERRRNPDLHYDTGTMVNLLYTGGKLYWVPFLKDDCPFIHDEFVIPRPWTMSNLLRVRNEAMERSVEYLKDTKCLECVHFASCMEKGISTIMQKLSIRDCLVGLDHVS